MARTRIQTGSANTATGDDVVSVQAGRVLGRAARVTGDRAAPETTPPADEPAEPGVTVNVRSGGAAVGTQADVVVGDITVRLG